MSDSESEGFESERNERKSRKSKGSKRSKCRRKVSSASVGILRYLCIMICAFSLSIVLMSIGLIYEDFEENEQKIRSARPNVELSYLQSIPHGQSYDITKFNAPRALAEMIPGDKYLLPILPFDVGPNNLFRIFKESIPIAVGMNFTLVMPAMHQHPRMEPFIAKNNTNEPKKDFSRQVEVPIFDTKFNVTVEFDPDRTIDYKLLKAMVPTVPHGVFESACKSTVEMLVECGDIDPKRNAGIKFYEHATNLKIAHRMNIKNLHPDHKLQHNLLNLRKNLNLHNANCVALVLGKKCLGNREKYLEYWKKYAPHIRRPRSVQDAAKAFFEQMFNSRQYAGIHWRYDTYDWNDMCKESRPDAARLRNGVLCQYSEKLEGGDKEILDMMSGNLKKKLEDMKIGRAYMAAPPQINNTIAMFKRAIPNLYTVDDLRHWIKTKRPESIGLIESNYMLSHLEQEIMYLSTKYLASPLSSWSQTVFLDRKSVGIEDDESILSVLLPNVTDLPELWWLFPEGDQDNH